MTSRLLTIALAAILAAPIGLAAQTPVSIPGSEQFTMKSKGGVEYRIDVWLPPGKDSLRGPFPTFYVLDGNAFFASAAEIYRGHTLQGEWPHLMIVGVGYPETSPSIFSLGYTINRTRDYTPTRVVGEGPVAEAAGHAAEFMTFLKDELMPTIESRYRGDPNDRGIGGHSLGGLFTTYALMHEPGLFSKYWLGSPSLWWDNHTAWKWVVPAVKASTQPQGRAFLTVGGEEGFMVTDMKGLADTLRRRFPKLQSASRVYTGESHVTVISGAVSNALRYLYSDYGTPKIAFTPALAASYVGKWSAAGTSIDLRRKGAGLDLTLELSGQKITSTVEAITRDRLFVPTLGSVITAERDGAGKIVHLRLNLLGATTFERAK